MPPSRDVLSLYEIADKRRSSKPLKETLDAKSLLKLIKKEASAFRKSDSRKLRELVGCFHECQALAARNPGSKQLKDSIFEFFTIIDECFFFKTLTREVKTKKGRQQLVTFKVEDNPSSQSESPGLTGIWDPAELKITVWMKRECTGDDSSDRYAIESVLHSCLHESIHAFIWLFENEDHPKHEERVAKDGAHGSIFLEMLRVIGERVGELTNSREWKEARYRDSHGPEEDDSDDDEEDDSDDDDSDDSDYDEEDLPDAVSPPMGAPGFRGPGFPPSGFPPGGFPSGTFPPGGFPPGGVLPGGFPPGSFPPGGFPPGGVSPGGFPPSGFPPSGFPPSGFPPGGVPPGGFPPSGFPPGGFPPSGFPPGGFPPGGFPPGGYSPGGFPFHK